MHQRALLLSGWKNGRQRSWNVLLVRSFTMSSTLSSDCSIRSFATKNGRRYFDNFMWSCHVQNSKCTFLCSDLKFLYASTSSLCDFNSLTLSAVCEMQFLINLHRSSCASCNFPCNSLHVSVALICPLNDSVGIDVFNA